MSAPTGRSGLAPGACLDILTQMERYRKQGAHVTNLPRLARGDVIDLLDAVRGFMAKDIHVGPVLEGAMKRITGVVADGSLAALQTYDLKTVRTFLCAVPTTSRGGA